MGKGQKAAGAKAKGEGEGEGRRAKAKAQAAEEMRAWRQEMKEARRRRKLQLREERGAAAAAAGRGGAPAAPPAAKRRQRAAPPEAPAAEPAAKRRQRGAPPEAPAAEPAAKRRGRDATTEAPRARAGSAAPGAEAHKVVVAGIPFHITEERLREDFAECGEVTSCRLLLDRESGTSRGIAFVSFAGQEGVTAALAYHGQDYGGRALTVEVAKQESGKRSAKGAGKGAGKGDAWGGPGEKPAGCTSVIVKGLAYSVSEDDLKKVFKGCGAGVQHVNMLRDRATGAFRGIAFVDFDDEDAVDEAVKLHGSTLNGRVFSMDYAPPRQKSQGPGKKPDGCTSVVVKGLAFAVTELSLKKAFKSCGGGPTSVRIKTDKQTGEPTGIAFLDFASGEAVDAAVRLSGTELKGRPFKVEYAAGAAGDGGAPQAKSKQKKVKPPGCTSVVVRGLAEAATEAYLMKKFRACGEGPRNVNVVMDKETGRPSGMAFVNFSSEAAVDEAVRLDGAEWKGQAISIGYVKPKPR